MVSTTTEPRRRVRMGWGWRGKEVGKQRRRGKERSLDERHDPWVLATLSPFHHCEAWTGALSFLGLSPFF
jgi:hypothetical protein